MILWQKDGYQVVQHERLQYFYVKKWMEGDNPRSYGRHWDYFTVKTFNCIEKVKDFLRGEGFK